MPQIPLDLADFILAYSTARTWFTYGNSRGSCKGWDQRKAASKKGVDSLRTLRDSKRLPRGVRALRAKIEGHLGLVCERYTARNYASDELGRKNPLDVRFRHWLEERVVNEFDNREIVGKLVRFTHRRRRRGRYVDDTSTPRLETHGPLHYQGYPRLRGDSYYRSASITVSFPSEVRTVGAPTCKGGKDSWSHRGQYSLTLCDDWKSTVLDEGLANIDGRFVLEAKADWPSRGFIDQLKYEVPHVDCVRYGTWVEKGRGYELKAVGGLIVRLDTGESFLVSMGTTSYTAAFRKAAKEARKRQYQAAKAARAAS